MRSKFDSTRREWESHKINEELPLMSDLNDFLKLKCELLEKLEIAKGENKPSENKFFKFSKFKNNKKVNALMRFNKIEQLKLCNNCFNPWHVTQNCNVKAKCRLCGRIHNTLLHISDEFPVTEQGNIQQSLVFNDSMTVQAASATTSVVSRVANTYSLLLTAVIIICDSLGYYNARVLLDPGS